MSSSTSSNSQERIRIRVRSGQNEAEIEADVGRMREAIELIPEIAAKFPAQKVELTHLQQESALKEQIAALQPSHAAPEVHSPSQLPAISVERGDSLSDIIQKFFADQWGKSPRKLLEVRDALQSYGLNYPKQSVAVALLRLAKSSKIRRFKSEGGEYVYTASTSVISGPTQVLVLPDAEVPETSVETAANV